MAMTGVEIGVAEPFSTVAEQPKYPKTVERITHHRTVLPVFAGSVGYAVGIVVVVVLPAHLGMTPTFVLHLVGGGVQARSIKGVIYGHTG